MELLLNLMKHLNSKNVLEETYFHSSLYSEFWVHKELKEYALKLA